MVRIIVGGKVVTEKQLSRIKFKKQEKSKKVSEKKIKTEKERKERELEKKRDKLMKTLGRLARKKVGSRRTFKKSKTTIHLRNQEVPSILADPNRFFKDEVGEAEHALFFR